VSPLLIAFVGVLLVPLFVASWRLSLYGLAAQGLLMAWIHYQVDPALDTAGAWVVMFDLVVVRGLGAPLVLYAVLRSRGATARNDSIAPNLMSWTLALALVFVAFRFGDMLVPVEGSERWFVAGAAAGLLLGLLVLAMQTGPFSQMVGALRIENAIALFELGNRDHDPWMQGAQTLILIATVLLFRWYLRTLPLPSTVKISAVEGMAP
jgi:hydrogenase-4 membrane subunit HyfE